MKLQKFIPILEWLPKYNRSQFKSDFSAGITVSIILIPQGIAYALIAGLPPIYGLYCALIPQIVYAVFGTSRQVAIGPVAMDSLIVATGVSTVAIAGSENYIACAILLAFIVGIIQFLMGIFRLGFVVNYLSKPIITGFTSAVALIIGLNQFRNLVGVDFFQSDQIHHIIVAIVNHINELNRYTTAIGILSIICILIFKKINKNIPYALIVIGIGTFIMRYYGNYFPKVAIIKEIPAGLPSFSAPLINADLIQQLMPIAVTLVIVGYLEVISIGKTLEAKQNEYTINPSQELIALGLSNIFGSFFKAYPTTSSFSRSAINQEAGAKTGMASLISVGFVILTLLFLTPLFYYVPKTILAAIIIIAVFGLINIQEAKKLWKTNLLDFWLTIATFIATIFLGIEYGILIGVLLSFCISILKNSTSLFKTSYKK